MNNDVFAKEERNCKYRGMKLLEEEEFGQIITATHPS